MTGPELLAERIQENGRFDRFVKNAAWFILGAFVGIAGPYFL